MPDYKIKVLECDLHDTRLTQRHLRAGRLDQKGHRAYLDALPDLAAEGEEFVVHLGAEPEEEEAEV
jgi:hypothetical protein